MGSTWTVRVSKPPPGLPAHLIQTAAQAVLDRVEQEMSTWRDKSELSRFNRSTGTDWVPVAAEMASVADVARQVSDQTGGAFDVTVYPLVNLWGFGPQHPAGPTGTVPTQAMIDQARRHVNYRLLDIRDNPPALRKSDPKATIDFSGIAKGYAAQEVGRRLDEIGCADFLVSVGGETCAQGNSHLGRPWRVGIENPTPGVHRVLYTAELKDQCLSTSGDYRNFFDANGRRYCHEIDPATGRPATNPPASVTVIHPNGAYADAMATALMVLGPDKGFDLAQRLNLAALFITRADGHFVARPTPRFAPMHVLQ
jgi:thiamine biosynthesis lipoprotein